MAYKKSIKRTGHILLVIMLILTTIFPYTKISNTVQAANEGLKNPTMSGDIRTWDCVWFGNYYQSDETGEAKEPIKWRVLSVDGDDVFLLADKNLDVYPYHDAPKNVTWETCDMRTWLNSDFYNAAFSPTEQSAIQNTTVINADNPTTGTPGGNDTTDKVFLLSYAEIINPAYGFLASEFSSSTREAKNTAWVAKGGTIQSDNRYSAGTADIWWLRSPGSFSNIAMRVYSFGNVDGSGYYVYYDYAVRPALHLNLSSSNLWYAGTVSSDGTMEEKEISETPIKILISQITLNQTSVALDIGKTFTILPTITPINATNQNLSFSSDKEEVASVDKNGIIKANKEGSAVITVSAKDESGKTAKLTVTVKPIELVEQDILISQITLNQTSVALDIGKTFTILPAITPSNATNQNLSFSSEKEEVAIVDKNGIIKANKEGSAVITVSATDGSEKTAKITVTVKPKTPIKPKAPQSVKVKKQTNTTAKITWKKDKKAAGYEVWRSTKKDKGYTRVTPKKGIKANSFVNKKLKNKKTYYYKVRSYQVINGKKIYGTYSQPKRLRM